MLKQTESLVNWCEPECQLAHEDLTIHLDDSIEELQDETVNHFFSCNSCKNWLCEWGLHDDSPQIFWSLLTAVAARNNLQTIASNENALNVAASKSPELSLLSAFKKLGVSVTIKEPERNMLIGAAKEELIKDLLFLDQNNKPLPIIFTLHDNNCTLLIQQKFVDVGLMAKIKWLKTSSQKIPVL